MLQQVMTNPGEIIFREVPVPEIKDNQVLVKIMNIGICGSDIHVYHGKHPFTKYPVTQGHEVSGEVVKTGDSVTEFHVGQKVTIEPQVYCGHCYPCRHGKYNLCEELKVMGFQTTGTASEYFAVDASIARGLDYYTGTVYETFLNDYKSIGSICSGGRYNNLSEFYTDKKMPGVGMSIGLTRLFFILNDIGLIKADKKSISEILIISMIEDLTPAIETANKLTQAGINTEIYFDNKKIKTKFKYADKLKIPYVIVIGEDEIKTGTLTLRNMETGEQEKKNVEEIVSLMKYE